MLCPNRTESFKTASPAGAAEKKPTGLSTAVIASAILLLLAAALCVLPGCGGSSSSSTTETNPVSKAKVGDVVQLGDYQWRVLATEGGKALVITEDVIEVKAFNEGRDDTTWENCTLRSYLNGEFYNKFNDSQKKAIADTKNANPNNPDYGTPSGNETTDKVFCLSMDEANKYFAEDDDRIANYNGEPYSWWLRTLGSDTYIVSYVGTSGDISRSGHFADYTEKGYGGIRPAMWVTL